MSLVAPNLLQNPAIAARRVLSTAMIGPTQCSGFRRRHSRNCSVTHWTVYRCPPWPAHRRRSATVDGAQTHVLLRTGVTAQATRSHCGVLLLLNRPPSVELGPVVVRDVVVAGVALVASRSPCHLVKRAFIVGTSLAVNA
jgi:hypothetical protein